MPGKQPSSWTAALPKFAVLAVLIGGVALILWNLFPTGKGAADVQSPVAGGPTVNVVVPATFSNLAADGRILFDRTCAACHGQNAAGTDRGPPLVHDIYNPGHHSDDSFVLAARMGVRSHHWPYGDMPAQPGVTEAQARAIATYVRELQAVNGIVARPHRM